LTASSIELPEELVTVLADLPTAAGGTVVLLATDGSPPGLAMLSTGDVYVEADTARVAVHASSSATQRLQNGFTLLVPADRFAYRIEVSSAHARQAGPLVVIEGQIAHVRPTSEPPWQMTMSFAPDGADPTSFVSFWREVRSWLTTGAVGDAPSPPAPLNVL
jgi:hypothetical protein